MRLPDDPEPQGVLESKRARQRVGEERRLCHHQPNEIIGQQIDPHLLAGQSRSLTTLSFDTRGAFDVAWIQHDMPATSKQGL